MTEQIEVDYQNVDYFSEHFNNNYDQILGDVVQNCPVTRSRNGYPVVTRHADLRKCLLDTETFINGEGILPERPEGMPPIYPAECDGDTHRALRGPFNRLFTRGAVAKWEPATRQIATDLIEGFLKGETDDLAGAISSLPGLVLFQEVLAQPEDRLAPLAKLSDAVMCHGGSPEEIEAAPVALGNGVAVIMEEAAKRPSPPDDFLNTLMTLTQDGDDVPFEIKHSIAMDFVLGGLDTTAGTIGQAVYHLAKDPALRRQLRESPDRIGDAADELLRIYTPAVMLLRTAKRDVEVAGHAIASGSTVGLLFAAACRDPSEFPAPETFDMDRPNLHRSLAFSAGPHRCVGAHLAQMELRVALEVLLTLVPEFTVPDGYVPRYKMGLARRLDNLRVHVPL